MNTRILASRALRHCFIAILVASPIVVSFAQQGGNVPDRGDGKYGGGPDMMGGCNRDCLNKGMMGSGMGGLGMMGGNSPGCGGDPVGWDPGLKLSHDQKIRMNAIIAQSHKAKWLLMGRMLDEQSKLRDLYAAPRRDQAAIDTSYGILRDLRRQIQGISADEHKRIGALLTREQRERLSDY